MENKSAPNWNAFLNHIFNGDGELIATVQRLFGEGISRLSTPAKIVALLSADGLSIKDAIKALADARNIVFDLVDQTAFCRPLSELIQAPDAEGPVVNKPVKPSGKPSAKPSATVAIKIKADDLAIQFFYDKLKSPAFASALVERFKDLRECIVIEQDDLRAADGTREVLVRFKPSDALSDFMAAFAG